MIVNVTPMPEAQPRLGEVGVQLDLVDGRPDPGYRREGYPWPDPYRPACVRRTARHPIT